MFGNHVRAWRFYKCTSALHLTSSIRALSPSPLAVQALFDFYATSFDESLKGLDYSSPDMLREVLGGMKRRYKEVFDAGCGTGLLGPLFRDISGEDRMPQLS